MHCEGRAVQSSIQEQLLYRYVEWFRGGLVFDAHLLLYYSTLGLRVIKKKGAQADLQLYLSRLGSTVELPDYSQLDMLGSQFKFVNCSVPLGFLGARAHKSVCPNKQNLY